jgi:hypothetical protein
MRRWLGAVARSEAMPTLAPGGELAVREFIAPADKDKWLL